MIAHNVVTGRLRDSWVSMMGSLRRKRPPESNQVDCDCLGGGGCASFRSKQYQPFFFETPSTHNPWEPTPPDVRVFCFQRRTVHQKWAPPVLVLNRPVQRPTVRTPRSPPSVPHSGRQCVNSSRDVAHTPLTVAGPGTVSPVGAARSLLGDTAMMIGWPTKAQRNAASPCPPPHCQPARKASPAPPPLPMVRLLPWHGWHALGAPRERLLHQLVAKGWVFTFLEI